MPIVEVSPIPPQPVSAVQAADQTSDVDDTPPPLRSVVSAIVTMHETSTVAEAGAALSALLEQARSNTPEVSSGSASERSGQHDRETSVDVSLPSLEMPEVSFRLNENQSLQSPVIDNIPARFSSESTVFENVVVAAAVAGVAASAIGTGVKKNSNPVLRDRVLPVTPASSIGSATSTDVGSGSSMLKNAQAAYVSQAREADVEAPRGEIL